VRGEPRYHVEVVRRLLTPVLIASLALPQIATAAPPEGPPPPPSEDQDADEDAPVGELSRQGERRGAIELGIASLLTGTAIGLAAFGTVQFSRARKHVDFCKPKEPEYIYDGDTTDDPTGIDPCVFDPPPLGFASAGLSWGFSAILLTGAGLLFARGARILGDARRWDRMQLTASPWWRRDGGGASFTLRF
jgi:hypothetical protein